ncbi:NAD(P)H-binding protein [Uliginosibacterium gangwonense]|uniref:NAD(P)H-binding protein n=1 Tax=Uliginosibacterium gangwonense TaxID=392736 RepID=UPI00037940C0|nr:NAD(P)H-binding protein [Uliginosibacterium gangwonense]
MKVLLFGATGMVGQGVLRACLADPEVELVQTVGRTATGLQHLRLVELVHADLFHLEAVQDSLRGFDACFFCLGASALRMGEVEFTRINHDLPLAVAQVLIACNQKMTFVYVSGAGSNSYSHIMWARVKGHTEVDLLSLPFKAVYLFRPGLIQPLQGIRSKTPLYRVVLTLAAPVLPVLRWLLPHWVLTTEIVGRAMLAVVRQGSEVPFVEAPEIARLAALR